MRRMITFVLLVLLLPVMAVSAQENEVQFDLNPETFLNVNDLGFRFYYPEGWIFDNTQGITLIEQEADVEPLLDQDDSTTAEGLFMRILGVPADEIEDFESLTLEAAAEDLLKQLGGTAVQSEAVTVLARPALAVAGTSDDGRAGILTVWKQTDYMVIATLSAPDLETITDLAFSWGVVLGLAEPLDTLPLGKEVLNAPLVGFTLPYPDGWMVNPANPIMVVELESDLTASVSEGGAVLMVEQSLDKMQVDPNVTLEEFVEIGRQIIRMDEPVESSQVVVFDQPAIMIKGQDTAGSEQWGLLVASLIDGNAVIIAAFASTREGIDAFEPTLIKMLESIQAVEA